MAPETLTTFLDKTGCTIGLSGCTEADLDALLRMYLHFAPRPASQGLPPPDNEGCRRWVKGLFEIGEGFLAWDREVVVGHAVLIPEPSGEQGEFLIFVDQDYRNRGIGKQLTRVALERAAGSGMKTLWLSVETYNFRAIGLYKRFGFGFRDMDPVERTMEVRL